MTKNLKTMLLTLGTTVVMIAPIVTAIACGTEDANTKPIIAVDKTVKADGERAVGSGNAYTLTLDVNATPVATKEVVEGLFKVTDKEDTPTISPTITWDTEIDQSTIGTYVPTANANDSKELAADAVTLTIKVVAARTEVAIPGTWWQGLFTTTNATTGNADGTITIGAITLPTEVKMSYTTGTSAPTTVEGEDVLTLAAGTYSFSLEIKTANSETHKLPSGVVMFEVVIATGETTTPVLEVTTLRGEDYASGDDLVAKIISDLKLQTSIRMDYLAHPIYPTDHSLVGISEKGFNDMNEYLKGIVQHKKYKFTMGDKEVDLELDLRNSVGKAIEEMELGYSATKFSSEYADLTVEALANPQPNISAYTTAQMGMLFGIGLTTMMALPGDTYNFYLSELEALHKFSWELVSSDAFKAWDVAKDYTLMAPTLGGFGPAETSVVQSGAGFDDPENVVWSTPEPNKKNESSNFEAKLTYDILNFGYVFETTEIDLDALITKYPDITKDDNNGADVMDTYSNDLTGGVDYTINPAIAVINNMTLTTFIWDPFKNDVIKTYLRADILA